MDQYYNQTTDLFLEEPVLYAGFWRRFLAALLDGIILFIPNLIIELLLIQDSPVTSWLLTIGLGWIYAAGLESSSAQATWGKQALGISVTTTSGDRISFAQATGRHFGKWVSALILFIGYLMMLWDDQKQTLHDKMANTLVVK